METGLNASHLTCPHFELFEGNETFNVALSNATNGATISDSSGVGTITDDDGAATPNLVVNGGFENGNFSGWTLSGNYGGNQIYIAPTVFPGEGPRCPLQWGIVRSLTA